MSIGLFCPTWRLFSCFSDSLAGSWYDHTDKAPLTWSTTDSLPTSFKPSVTCAFSIVSMTEKDIWFETHDDDWDFKTISQVFFLHRYFKVPIYGSSGSTSFVQLRSGTLPFLNSKCDHLNVLHSWAPCGFLWLNLINKAFKFERLWTRLGKSCITASPEQIEYDNPPFFSSQVVLIILLYTLRKFLCQIFLFSNSSRRIFRRWKVRLTCSGYLFL